MKTIWVPRKSGHDFSAAQNEFGQLCYLVPDGVSPFQVDVVKEHMLNLLPHIKEDDTVIPCGPPHYMAILANLWQYDHMNLLLYHAKTKNYLKRRMELPCQLSVKS